MENIEVFEDEGAFEGVPVALYRYRCGKAEPVSFGTVSLKDDKALAIAFLIDPKMHGKGIGRRALELGLEKFSKQAKIDYIIGKWKRDNEFSAFEDYSSTNLTVFKKNYLAQVPQEESALQTPTGKWAASAGYDKAKVIENTEDSVEVHFYKVLPEAKPTSLPKDDDLLDLL